MIYTVVEVAALLGVSRRRVQQLAQSRALGRRIGPMLVFSAGDIEAMRVRVPGRPKRAAL